MPSHELYYIKKDELQFKKYLKELNSLFIEVLDDYEEYISEPKNIFKTILDILLPFIFLIILFGEKFQKWGGTFFSVILSVIFIISLLYMNRKKILEKSF